MQLYSLLYENAVSPRFILEYIFSVRTCLFIKLLATPLKYPKQFYFCLRIPNLPNRVINGGFCSKKHITAIFRSSIFWKLINRVRVQIRPATDGNLCVDAHRGQQMDKLLLRACASSPSAEQHFLLSWHKDIRYGPTVITTSNRSLNDDGLDLTPVYGQ